MESQPPRLILEPLFSFRGRQVEVWQEAPSDSPDGSRRVLLSTIELDRSIALASGARYTIQRSGIRWSPSRALWHGDVPSPGGAPLALYEHERVGMLRWRSVLHVGADPGSAYLLRRRSSWGGPANVDVVPLLPEGEDTRSFGPVVLRVERVGRWKRSLQALVLDPAALPLLIVLFVLNLLAVQERAAAASSAG
jgi:hypothetical protein